MYKVVSFTKHPLIAELSLLLHEMSPEYEGMVLCAHGWDSDNVDVNHPGFGFASALREASVAFFPECDEDIKQYVHQAMLVGVPVVMFANCQVVPVEHDKTGMLYINCAWATKWIRELTVDQELRTRIVEEAKRHV